MLTFICLGLMSNFNTHALLTEEVVWKRASLNEQAQYLFIDEEAGSRPREMDIDVDDIPIYTEI